MIFINPISSGKDKLNNKIDFIACLGGDGTLLYASSLFQVSLLREFYHDIRSLSKLKYEETFKLACFKAEVSSITIYILTR